MDIKELSKIYCDCTLRMHGAATRLYEALHTPGGTPRYDMESLHNTIRKYRKEIDEEFSMIRTAIHEYKEEHHTDIS